MFRDMVGDRGEMTSPVLQSTLPEFVPIDPELSGTTAQMGTEESSQNILSMANNVQDMAAVDQQIGESNTNEVIGVISSNNGGGAAALTAEQSQLDNVTIAGLGGVKTDFHMVSLTVQSTVTNTTYTAPVISNLTTLTTSTVQTATGYHILSQCEALLQPQYKLHDNAFELLGYLLANGVQNVTVVCNQHDQMMHFYLCYEELSEELVYNDP